MFQQTMWLWLIAEAICYFHSAHEQRFFADGVWVVVPEWQSDCFKIIIHILINGYDWIVTNEILCKHILQKFISMSTWIDGNSPLWLDHIQLLLAERVDCSCGRWWCIHGNVPISQFLTWKTYVKTCNNHPVSMHLPINQPNHCWPVQAWLLNPLLKIQKTAENQHVSWVNQVFQMAMSNSNLLPFGNSK